MSDLDEDDPGDDDLVAALDNDTRSDRPVWRPSSGIELSGLLDYYGRARVATTVVVLLVAITVGWWLMREPAPPIEASLPTATAPRTAGAPSSSVVVATTTAPVEVAVHVAGAVVRPGLYRLDAGARVADALDAAGGVTGTADVDRVNLAAVVPDGVRIFVPHVGQDVPVPVEPAATDGPDSGDGDSAAVLVDVNTADAAGLENLPGVGPTIAAAIIDDRERHGPYASLSDLERVPGIGPARLAAIADLVSL
ncbi:MAG: ComEA family DNA-binding protein [Actinomycetota bacterium]